MTTADPRGDAVTDPIPTAKVDDADRERIAAGLLMLVDPADALEAAIARIAYLEERNDELQQDVARLTSDLGQARETISALTSSRARHLGERNDARAEVDRLAALLAAAEEGAEKQRQAACNLRDALDRVATAAGVADGSGDEVADRIVEVIGRLREGRDAAQAEVDALRAERDHYRVMIAKLAAEIDADDGRGDVTGEKGWRLLADAVMGRVFGLRAELSAARAELARLTAAPVPVAIDDWHEGVGCVLWWHFPIEEPPYSGTPLDSDWPGYHTHWTRFAMPDDPATGGPIGAANLHPDGCHTTGATAPRDCAGDGHHECSSCARLDRAERAANGDPAIGGGP